MGEKVRRGRVPVSTLIPDRAVGHSALNIRSNTWPALRIWPQALAIPAATPAHVPCLMSLSEIA